MANERLTRRILIETHLRNATCTLLLFPISLTVTVTDLAFTSIASSQAPSSSLEPGCVAVARWLVPPGRNMTCQSSRRAVNRVAASDIGFAASRGHQMKEEHLIWDKSSGKNGGTKREGSLSLQTDGPHLVSAKSNLARYPMVAK